MCCLARGENIFKRAPYVDLIFGPQTLHKVPELLDQEDKIKAVDVSFPIEEKFDSLLLPEASGPSVLFQSWRAVQNFVLFALCPIPGAKKLAENQGKSLMK